MKRQEILVAELNPCGEVPKDIGHSFVNQLNAYKAGFTADLALVHLGG